MRLLLLSRISSLILATSFILNLLAVLELRDVQREERQLQVAGQRALTEVSSIRSELLAMQKIVAVYVATADPSWLIYYYDIVELHAGRKRFVSPPAAGYWDSLLAREGAPIPTEATGGITLQDRLTGLDIVGDNRLLTLNLMEASRRLRERERVIFAATQGLFDAKQQRFVSEAAPNPAYATSYMYSQAHLQLGNEVEGYLNTLFDDIKGNIESRSQIMQERTAQAGTLLLGLSLLSGAILLLFIWLLRMGILKPIQNMANTAGNVADGDYSAAIPESKLVQEIGVLGQAMNRMIRAVRFDLMQKDLARKATEAMYRAEQAREKAEMETRIKSRFLANMTHELRTPLNAVIGLSQLLFKTNLTARQANYVSKVVDAGKFLLGLVNDILDFSKAEAGKIALEAQPVNLRQMIDNAVSLLSLQAEQKGIGLHADIELQDPAWALTDPLRMRQILTNLLSNAVKFTHAGQVRVRARQLGDAPQTIALELQISDTGIGMTAEQVERAFEEFRQADQSTTRLYGGTGLGLTIVKRLVDALQGRIAIASEPGQGTVFTLHFTLQRCEEPVNAPLTPETEVAVDPAANGDIHARSADVQSIAAQTLGEGPDDRQSDHRQSDYRQPDDADQGTVQAVDQGTGPLTGLFILLVEDNPINQEVARDTLELEGATVMLCENGQEAVEFFSNPDARVDLVLMDVEMPVMDGYAATEALRRRFNKSELPILGMTAHAFDEARDRCLIAGMNNVMTKPFDIERLAGWIRANLKPTKE